MCVHAACRRAEKEDIRLACRMRNNFCEAAPSLTATEQTEQYRFHSTHASIETMKREVEKVNCKTWIGTKMANIVRVRVPEWVGPTEYQYHGYCRIHFCDRNFASSFTFKMISFFISEIFAYREQSQLRC